MVRRETVTVMRDGKPVKVKRRVVRRVSGVGNAAARQPLLGKGTRLVPRHVWEQQQESQVDAPVPKGFRPAWKDDRLNKQRAHQTLDGIYAIDLVWTRTLPRKLLVRSTGRDVTHKYPGLKYPYHSYDEMRAAGYNISTKDQAAKPAKKWTLFDKTKPQKKAVIATKSVTRAVPATPTKGRYVQVGTFKDEANARNTAARLQRLGLPARLGKLTKGGKTYRIVLAGPFAADQLGAALGQARKAGFHDAFVR
jgi:hypothetical protein